MLEEHEPIFNEVEKETDACDPDAVKWAKRVLTLVILCIALLTMTILSWSKIMMYENDNEIPVPFAMLNTCLNRSWNVVLYEKNVYKVNYYSNIDTVFVDSNCVVKESMPFIHISDARCCNFVLWNTI